MAAASKTTAPKTVRPAGAEGPEDGDVAAAGGHRIVDRDKDAGRGDERHQVGDERENLVEPADLAEKIGHDRADGIGEGQPVALLVVHHVEA